MSGRWRTYHESGELATEATHGFTGQEGVARAWDAEGALREESTFTDGRLEGPHRRWHPDGRTLSVEGQHVAGAKDGRWTRYDARGRVVWEEDWRAGALAGPVRLSEDFLVPLSEAESAAKATVDGKYAQLLRRIAAPEDRERYADFHDYGAFPATDYLGETKLPAGHWVYVFPYWYVWAEARATR